VGDCRALLRPRSSRKTNFAESTFRNCPKSLEDLSSVALRTALPSAKGMRYQVLRVAVPRKGRALALVQLAYDRGALPANKSQNQLEQDALLAVIEALPAGVCPVDLADRGFLLSASIFVSRVGGYA
jgi:hypothetical protein